MPGPFILPAGVSPVSSDPGTVLEPPGLPPVMRASNLDPTTGEVLSLTRDVAPIPAAIQRQFRTVRGSGAAVLNDGQSFNKIQKNDITATRQIQFEIQRIFAPFVIAKTARIDQIVPFGGEASQWFGGAVVHWTDLSTGAAHSTSYPSKSTRLVPQSAGGP